MKMESPLVGLTLIARAVSGSTAIRPVPSAVQAGVQYVTPEMIVCRFEPSAFIIIRSVDGSTMFWTQFGWPFQWRKMILVPSGGHMKLSSWLVNGAATVWG